MDKSTLSKAQMDRAERLAKEIEGTASRNIHVQEERGQVSEQDGDWDEEDKYSGVGIVGKANAKEHKQQIGNVGKSEEKESYKEEKEDNEEQGDDGCIEEEEEEDSNDDEVEEGEGGESALENKPSKLSAAASEWRPSFPSAPQIPAVLPYPVSYTPYAVYPGMMMPPLGADGGQYMMPQAYPVPIMHYPYGVPYPPNIPPSGFQNNRVAGSVNNNHGNFVVMDQGKKMEDEAQNQQHSTGGANAANAATTSVDVNDPGDVKIDDAAEKRPHKSTAENNRNNGDEEGHGQGDGGSNKKGKSRLSREKRLQSKSKRSESNSTAKK